MKYLGYIIGIVFLNFCTSEAQDLKWIYKIGGTTAEYGVANTIDSDQNIYDVTNFMGTCSVANNLLYTSRGEEDILIRKSTSLGIQQWVKQLGGTKSDLGVDISVDIDENIFVIGQFHDSLFYDQNFILKTDSVKLASFIIKVSPVGDLIWARKFESNLSVSLKSVTAGLGEELLLTGNFEGDAILGFGLDAFNVTSNGGNDIFILKLNGLFGSPIFLKTIGGPDHEFVSQHTRDIQNNILITGDFRGLIDFDPGVNLAMKNSQGLTDAYLLKLSTNGDFQWIHTYGGIGIDYGHSVATDGDRNIVLTGRFSNEVSFLPVTSEIKKSVGGTDAFVIKIDKDGIPKWVNTFGNELNDQGSQVVINNTGIIYVSGLFRENVDFDPSLEYLNESISNGGADIFYLILNQDGTYNEHYALGGIANEQIGEMLLRQNGDLISVGGFGGIVDFDPTSSELNIISSGGLDAFMTNVSICVNPYLKTVMAMRPELCKGHTAVIQIAEGYLNSAIQWSWQKDSCSNITFASGTFINQVLDTTTSFFIKGFGNCVQNDICKEIKVKVFVDTLKIQDIALCAGDTLFVGNSKYYSSGNYIDTLISVAGCDSVVMSNVTIHPIFDFFNSIDLCAGDTIFVGNEAYTTAGTFVTVLNTVYGCDSTIITVINILPTTIENAHAIICEGDSVTIGTKTYTTSGTFIQATPGTNGCEDLLIVEIEVLKANYNTVGKYCIGDTVIVGSSKYFKTGVYTDSLTSIFGCDSIITSILTFSPSSPIKLFDYAICEGDSIIIGTKVYKKTGNYIDTLINVGGCDSIIMTDIRVLKVPAPVIATYNICEGDSIKVGNRYYKEIGTYLDTLVAISSCDSVISTTINYLPKQQFLTTRICEGDSLDIGGVFYKESGIFNIDLTNIYGCDSTIVLNLDVVPMKMDTFEYKICPGDSIVVENSIYKQPGIYTDLLSSNLGCDSIAISIITWNHRSRNLNIELCQGDSILYQGTYYKTTTLVSDTIVLSDGCDSIINWNLKVFPKFSLDTIFQICRGDSIKVGDSFYYNQGNFAESLVSVNGCDSTVFFEVKLINFTPIFFIIQDTLKAFAIQGGIYQWFECVNNQKVIIPGANKISYVPNKSGSFALSISANGCTFTTNCQSIILSDSDDVTVEKIKIYPNPTFDVLNIKTEKSGRIQIFNIHGFTLKSQYLNSGINQIDVNEMKAGTYFIQWSNDEEIKYIPFVKL